MAAWPLLDAMGQVVSGFNATELQYVGGGLTGSLDVMEDLNIQEQQYNSWEDFYRPVQPHGGNFTNLRRYNHSSPFDGLGQPDYGYQNDSRPQPQTFRSDNIVIVSDGFCGSTCAIFLELMKTQGRVKSIAVGGRPQYCPMQTVGGSKGSNDQEFQNLAEAAVLALAAADNKQQALFEPYLNAGLKQDWMHLLQRLSTWNPNGAVNFQNNIRKGDESVMPLQFVYEAADCRFFYTPQMIVDQSLVWQQAYALTWGNQTCPSHFTSPSSGTGFDTSYINSPPPACANNVFGADIEVWTYPGAYRGSKNGTSASVSASATASMATSTATSTQGSGPAASNAASALSVGGGAAGVFAAAAALAIL